MATTSVTITEFIDDLDGGKAKRTVTFAPMLCAVRAPCNPSERKSARILGPHNSAVHRGARPSQTVAALVARSHP